ncbi:MAG: DUF6496 domain-containing protein [Candidatus Saccharimonadales bacterium]
MNKHIQKAEEKVKETMEEFKHGKLKSGGSDKKVTSPKQAVASGISKVREAGRKVLPKKN